MAENPQEIYQSLVASGYTKKDAAKQAQAKTGMSVVTGRPIVKKLGLTKKGKVASYGGVFINPGDKQFGLY